jgi:hypothetical protein
VAVALGADGAVDWGVELLEGGRTTKPAAGAAGFVFDLVAGVGFEAVRFRLWSAGRGATIAREAKLPASDR